MSVVQPGPIGASKDFAEPRFGAVESQIFETRFCVFITNIMDKIYVIDPIPVLLVQISVMTVKLVQVINTV